MEVPRGFTRCEACKGVGSAFNRAKIEGPCDRCSGSGLVPTEKLREEAERAINDAEGGGWAVGSFATQADAVLRKVAEHIREER